MNSISYLSSKREHPKYDDITHNYDFCLLQLSSAIDFADRRLLHVTPACWPTGNVVPNSQACVIGCYTAIIIHAEYFFQPIRQLYLGGEHCASEGISR